MKLITAIIRPEKLSAVHRALLDAEITRITVSRCTGHGQQGGVELYRGATVEPDLLPKVRLDIACNDSFVEIAVAALIKAARSTEEGGRVGDGKIFIAPLDDCIRIRTGERGGQAI
jgi:nitrogen regulatory protein P-II 1